MTGHLPDTARPPFCRLPGQSSEEVARDIVAAFAAVADMPEKVQWVWGHAIRCLGDAGTDLPLRIAGETIAAGVDADPEHFDRHAYHNRQHFCEVMLAVCFLSQVHGLASCDSRLLLLAALIHDIDYEGRPMHVFEFEHRSIERATPILVAAGMTPHDVARLTTLVLATEPNEGARVALAAARFHSHEVPAPPVPAAASELAALIDDEHLSQLALILCEADLLPSVGLTVQHGMHLQDHLSKEWNRPLTTIDKLNFIDSVLVRGVIGPFFRTNAVAVRLALLESMDASG